MAFYTRCLRSLLFRLNAETAHHLAVTGCRFGGKLPLLPAAVQAAYEFTASELESTAAGLHFANPVGLAAGWDKSGHAVRLLDRLGFGFLEIGSVSAQPSLGNPRPRLFRLPADRAIVVNYGLPNDGAERVRQRLQSYRPRVPLGINLVATNFGAAALARTVDDVLADFEQSTRLLHPHASYLVLNLSCPNVEGSNTQNLFAVAGHIRRLLERIEPLGITCPVFLKVPPVADAREQERWLSEVNDFPAVRGFLFNLPAGKPATVPLKTARSVWESMPGAIAGLPVASLMDHCIATLFPRLDRSRHIIIGSGGIMTPADAYRKICLGASLIQIYTALIYEGPGLVSTLNRGLAELLRRDGFVHLQQAVGIEQSAARRSSCF